LLFCSSYLLYLNNPYSYFLQITDHDPTPKYICRVCYGQVEVTFRFATTCRINNLKHMENVTNDVLKTEYKKFMRLPVHFLVISN